MRILFYLFALVCKTRLFYDLAKILNLFLRTLSPRDDALIGKYAALYQVPEREAGELIKASFLYRLYQVLDILAFPAFSEKLVDQRLSMENMEYFDKAISLDKPIIFIQLHSGSFFNLAVWLFYQGKKINVVFMNRSRFRDYINRRLFTGFIRRRLIDYPSIENCLRAGESVLIMVDGVKAKYTESVRLNGAVVEVSTAILSLAASTGAILLPVYSRRASWNKVIFKFYPLIRPGTDINMQEILNLYRNDILDFPGQWYGLLK